MGKKKRRNDGPMVPIALANANINPDTIAIENKAILLSTLLFFSGLPSLIQNKNT